MFFDKIVEQVKNGVDIRGIIHGLKVDGVHVVSDKGNNYDMHTIYLGNYNIFIKEKDGETIEINREYKA